MVPRRAVLAGLGAALCPPLSGRASASPSAAGHPPLRVGLPGAFPLDPERLSHAALRLCGRSAVPVTFDGWGTLADHAAAGGSIDAALLPATGAGQAIAPDRPPSLWVRGGPVPRRVGVPLRHPAGDALLRDLLGPGLHIVGLAPGALRANLLAGLLDAAVLLGDAPGVEGLTRLPVPAWRAAALLPPLALRRVGAGA